ncbi:hypothetical protein GGR52DRAFT_433810 [Hypoxylon sp. FL1284]|nr:hypothetical protein GGR52DRAFT_433810 [Hypoxylon sp. FL1284]
MGSYVSVDRCQAHYSITLNCSVHVYNDTNNGTTVPGTSVTEIGGYTKGHFPGDPDIAGIGILGVFVAVTSFAISVGFVSVFWQATKTWRRSGYTEEKRVDRRYRMSLSDTLDSLVLACSDQQVFTGAAYAFTLRYWRGCTISAYHYNIVANMMLLTCATHLISVTIVRNYWKFPWLALLRVISITFVFIATGLLMTNQNANSVDPFPTGVPHANETQSSLFLPAACFQTDNHTAMETFEETTSDAYTFFMKNIAHSTPRNKIQGWNWYIITLLFYGAATIAELIRIFRRGRSRPGWRANVGNRLRRCCGLGKPLRKVVQSVFIAYLVLGVGIGCAVTIISAKYIFDLRKWVDKSGWIQQNQNPENDAKSFGQLVPIFSSALILFSFAQIISENCTRRSGRKDEDEEMPPQGGKIQYFDPSTDDAVSPPEKDKARDSKSVNVSAASLPGRVDFKSQSPWGSDLSFASTQAATPLLGGDGYFSIPVAPRLHSASSLGISSAQPIQPEQVPSPSPVPAPLLARDEARDISPRSPRS